MDIEESASAGAVEPSLVALITQSGRGDQDAFAQLYDQTVLRIHSLVLRVVRDPSLADEVTQEVYVEIWRICGRYRTGQGTALGWMCTIAHRRAVDRVRSVESQRRRDGTWHLQGEASAATNGVVERVFSRLDAGELHKGLGELNPQQREALELAYFGGLTQSEIAERLDVPLGTVKTRVRDGMRRLRTALEVYR